MKGISVVTAAVVAAAIGAGASAPVQVHAQGRVRRSVEPGAATRSIVVKSLAVTPADAGAAEVSLLLRVGFDFDSAVLTDAARRDLDGVAAGLNDPALRAARIVLEGHTDATGDAGYNLQLSEQRARAVVDYLVQRGVAAGRLRPAGYGEYRPLPEYAPADDRQRRVEIVRTF